MEDRYLCAFLVRRSVDVFELPSVSSLVVHKLRTVVSFVEIFKDTG